MTEKVEAPELEDVVRAARDKQSLRSAAKDIGVSPTTLMNIERGHVPDVPTLMRLIGWLCSKHPDGTEFTLPDHRGMLPCGYVVQCNVEVPDD